MIKMSLENLLTERRNSQTTNIDSMSTIQLVRAINAEDAKVATAVGRQNEQIAKAIDLAYSKYHTGGRLIYIGAGTSGRLGVLDAVELVPTYGISPKRAIGLIAGGKNAMFLAAEGAEDADQLGVTDLKKIKLNSNDVVLGLAASGRTPYVIGGLDYAQKIGAGTISIACVPKSLIGKHSQIAIEALVGPEVVTGSTRMKAGTAEKMILNMISTGVMIKEGKVYQNIMIDVKPTNKKLIDRSKRIISDCTGLDDDEASQLLIKSKMNVPLAILMNKMKLDFNQASKLLTDDHINISQIIEQR